MNKLYRKKAYYKKSNFHPNWLNTLILGSFVLICVIASLAADGNKKIGLTSEESTLQIEYESPPLYDKATNIPAIAASTGTTPYRKGLGQMNKKHLDESTRAKIFNEYLRYSEQSNL